MIGGREPGHLAARVERFDPRVDAWSSDLELPLGRSFAGAAALAGRIYVLGGAVYQDNGALRPLDTVEAYAPSLGE